MYLIGFTGILGLFLLEALFSSEFRSSFIKGPVRNRTILYMLSSLLVLYPLGQMGQWAKNHIPALLELSRYPVLDIVFCFLIAELLNWLFHYFKHMGYFWNFHFQHHLDTRYTVLLTSHTHAIEVLISGTLLTAILALFGFSQNALNAYYLFYTITKTYQHSAINYSLGPLDYLIISPRFHRLHHAKDLRVNFGITLTVWDIVFQTALWPKKNETCRNIGIEDSGEPFGFVAEHLYFLHAPWQHLRSLPERFHLPNWIQYNLKK